ncbi:MAG: T9SS type A sorting domain-containing protein [Saprospiraceae bacterium]|nr:T9SS type A sorting domain-containing protein [Saprospiraceae bacterium]
MTRILTVLVLILVVLRTDAQLSNGAPAPDFSVTDLNGNSWSLYGEMSGGKSACLDFSATWCSPCWSFHQSKVLNSVNTNLSSSTTVLFLEADFATNTNCLYNLSPCTKGTQGNWVAGTNYPMTDLSSTNGASVAAQYNVNFVPTLYVISPDFRVWNIVSRTYQEYYDWIIHSFSLAATETIKSSTCGDNGSIVLNVTGGLGTKKYKWSNGGTTKDLVGIPGGTYNVTITDAQGYFKSYGPFVVDGPLRKVAITSTQKTDNKCFGETKGAIKLTIAYGTAPYTYQWSNGETASQLLNIPAGNYTVTVTDAANCVVSSSYNISEPALLTSELTGINETCDDANGFISIVAKGGVTPYTYWLGNQKSPFGSFGKLKEGTYSPRVVDLNNCEVVEHITLTATHKPKLVINAPSAITCAKDTIQLLGEDSDNGSEFITEWKSRNGKILGDKYNLNIKTANAGTYELKITNTINTCVKIDSIIIKEDQKFPDIKVSGAADLNCYVPDAELKGETTELRTHVYWTKLNSNFKENKAAILISEGGSYVFNVKDTMNLCVSKDTIVIKENKIAPNIFIDLPKELNCKVASSIIHAENSDQQNDIERSWFTSDGNIVSGEKTLSPVVDKKGTYVLKLLNKTNGCESNQAVEVKSNTEFTDIKISELLQDISCIRPVVDIKTGLNSDYSVKWSTTNGGIKGTLNSADVQIEKEGDYNLYYENTKSLCDKTIAFAIREQKPLNPEFSIVQNELALRFSDLTPGIISSRVWNFGDGQTSTETSPVHTYSAAGEYQICLDVENECGVKKTCKNVSLTISSVLNLASWDIHPVECYGGNQGYIKLNVQGGTQPYTFEWSTGGKTNEITNLSAGDYNVKIIDALGAKIEKTFTVKEPAIIRQDGIDIRNENAGFKNGSLKIKIGGGTPGYIYLWSNGATTEEVSNLVAGFYSVKITDANGCEMNFGPFEVKAVTSTVNLSEKLQMQIEPNPIKDLGRIIITSENLTSRAELILVDLVGKEVYRTPVSDSKQIIDLNLNSFAKGFYLVTVRTNSSSVTKSLIKQ